MTSGSVVVVFIADYNSISIFIETRVILGFSIKYESSISKTATIYLISKTKYNSAFVTKQCVRNNCMILINTCHIYHNNVTH